MNSEPGLTAVRHRSCRKDLEIIIAIRSEKYRIDVKVAELPNVTLFASVSTNIYVNRDLCKCN